MATYANILVHQGADFLTTITVEEETLDLVNLDGYTIKGQIRKTYASETAYEIQLSPLVEDEGIVEFLIPSETTKQLRPGRYLYDVYVQSPNAVTDKLIEGIVTVRPRITRLEEHD